MFILPEYNFYVMFICCVILILKKFTLYILSVFHKKLAPAEEEQFFKMISHAQSGRFEDQRCSLPPSRSTPVTPTHNGKALNNNTGQPCMFFELSLLWQWHCRDNIWLSTTGADADAFFNRISSAQARRLDDQRVALPALPGISGSAERKPNGNTMVWIVSVTVLYLGSQR